MKKIMLRVLLLLLICVSLLTAAACGRVKFTINFDSNGGSECAPIETLGNETISMPNDPTKEGYEFAGWFWDNETFVREFTINSLLDTPLSSNMTVYAKWEPIALADYTTYSLYRFVVKFPEPLGDTVIDPDNMDAEDKELYDSILALYGKIVDISSGTIKFSGTILSLYNPVKYTLSGDKVNLDNSALTETFTEVTLSNNKFTFGAVSGGMGFVFEYTSDDYVPKMHTVNFDYVGATGGNEILSKQFEESKPMGALPTPTKTGYEFGGWFYFGTQITENTTYNFGKDITLSANWEKIDDTDTDYTTYSLHRMVSKFPGFGDTVIDPNNMSPEEEELYNSIFSLYGRTVELSSNSIRFSGTILSLYNPVKYTLSGKTVIFSNTSVSETFTEATLSGGKLTLSIVEDGMGFVFEYISPSYIPEMYTATFNYEGADSGNTLTSIQIKPGEAFGTLPLPERKGYEFAGWFLNDSLITETTVFSLNTDIILTAKWNIKTYTITYVLNGGYNTLYNPTTYKITDTIAIDNASKAGHTFDGWYLNAEFSGDSVTGIDASICENITLYAKFTANTFTLTFDYGFDITGEVVTSKDVTYGAILGELPSPERKGYSLDGWFDSNNNYYYAHLVCNLDRDMTLTAKWSLNAYHIAYFLNGGSNDSKNPVTYTIISDITLSSASKTGYTFDGWYLNAEFSGDSVTKIDTSPLRDISLYAKFTVNTYVVNFDYGFDISGDVVTSKDVTYGAAIGELPRPERKGYSLDGWFDSNNNYYYATLVCNLDSDITLTAKWSITAYHIAYFLNGGSSDSKNPVTYTIISDITLSSASKTGYTFDGWYLNADFSGDNVTKIDTSLLRDISLYAKFSVNTYVVTFDYGFDISGDVVTSKDVTYGAAIGELPRPERKGYSLDGWFDSNNNQYYAHLVCNLDRDMTLTAKWSINVYHIAYFLNGGSNDSKNPTTYTINSDITLSSASKTGYTFDGWYLSSVFSGDSVTKIDTSLLRDISLHAKFTVNTYVVTFDYGFAISGDIESTRQVAYNAEIGTLPFIDRPGYTFGGWFDNLGKRYYDTSIYSVAGDTTLKATWSEDTYQVRYVLNGGSQINSNPTAFTVSSNYIIYGAQRTGYTFDGWYLNAEFTGNKITALSNGITESITLYAKFTANKYSLTFDYNGATEGDEQKSKDIFYDSAYGELPTPKRFGYSFAGWFYSSSLVSANTIHKTTSNSIITARWNIITYNITYTLNGGTHISTNPKTYTVQNLPTLYGASKTGHTFEGWFTNPEFSGEPITGTAGFAEHLSLHAKFTVNTYTITFDYAGASGGNAVKNISVTYGTQVGTLPTPTNEPYIFGGWFTAANGGGIKVLETDIYNSAQNSTLYAYFGGTDNLSYSKLNTGFYSVSGNDPSATKIVIPMFYKGFEVRQIAVNAFNGYTNLTDIYFGDNITAIGEYAFHNCSRLIDLKLPNQLTQIGNSAFRNCTSLLRIDIPIKVTIIDEFTFVGCKALEEINFGDNVTKIGASAFSGATALKRVNSSVDGDFIIGNSVKHIDSYIFSGTSPIRMSIPFVGATIGYYSNESTFGTLFSTQDTLTDKATKQGRWIFNIPKTILQVTITNSTQIPAYAFQNCSWITDISINSEVNSIDTDAFQNCSSLKTFTAPLLPSYDAATLSYLAKYFGATEYNKSPNLVPASLTRFIINNNPTAISDYAFYGLKNILDITIPESVQNIGYRAFYNCSGLLCVNFSASTPPKLLEETFYGVTAVFRVPNGASLAYSQAFSGLSNEICESKGIVMFDTNGGNAIETQTLDSVSPVARPVDPIKHNHIFKGWFIDSAMTIPYDFSDIVTGTIILYAKWEVPEILINKTTTVNIDKIAEFYFRFTPTTSGTFTFSMGADVKTKSELYDSNGKLVKSGTYDGSQTNITIALVKGNTYTLKAILDDQTLTSDVSVVVRNG